MNFKSILYFFFIIFFSQFSMAQVAINTDDSNPDASAILDIKSTNKGILTPRMTTEQRIAISSPAIGLLVFDTETNSFWFYNGSAWAKLTTVNSFEYNGLTRVVSPNTVVNDLPNDDFVFGSNSLDDDGNISHDSRFFFDKSKAAFRAGYVENSNWNANSIGDYSFAIGENTKASGGNSVAAGHESEAIGDVSFALGEDAEASGNGSFALGYNVGSYGNFSLAAGYDAYTYGTTSFAIGDDIEAYGDYSFALGNFSESAGKYSMAFGLGNKSFSMGEMVAGMYATNYAPINVTTFDNNDRLFTIGKGLNDANRSDALVILKSGNTTLNGDLGLNGALTINSAFSFPTADGTNGQTLSTDGNGTLSWTSFYANSIVDADNDTKIQVDESADEDIIRFDLGGSERLVLQTNYFGRTMIELPNNGDGNLFFGNNNGQYTNLSGEYNTFVGNSAGQANTSGSGNSFFGVGSGHENTTGNNNTFIGRGAGYFNSGNRNTFIGQGSGQENFTGSSNILIGYNAAYDENTSHRLYIEPSSGLPLIYGEFDNDFLRINGTLDVVGGIVEELAIVDGSQSMKIKTNETSNYIQIDVEGTGHSADDIYIGDVSTSTNEVYMLGNVGIGTNTPGYQLQVGNSGDGTMARANAWNTFSDRRLKRDFQKIENPIKKLNALHGYYYYWVADKKDQSRQLGVIAQEVETVLPEIVKTDKAGIKSVDYSKLTAYLIEVNKTQQTEINQLKADNEVLKTQMNRIDELEAMILDIKAEN